MTRSPGDEITASEFNDAVVQVNKYWADNYSTAAITDTDKTNHRYGWGQTPALELDGLDDQRVTGHVDCENPGDLIKCVHMNQLIARANASGDHLGLSTNLSYKVIESKVLAADINAVTNRFSATVIDDGLSDSRSAQIQGQNTMDDDNANSNVLSAVTRTQSWNQILVSELDVSFDSYTEARYFFNSAGAITLDIDITGASSVEGTKYASNLAHMGTIHLLSDDVVVSGTGGYAAADVGFYGLNDTEYQLLYSYTFGNAYSTGGPSSEYGSGYLDGNYFSGGVFSEDTYNRGYGGTGYLAYGSEYAVSKISVYGKYKDDGATVSLKVYMQSPESTSIDGTLTQSLGYVIADTQTATGGIGGCAATAELDVTDYAPSSHTIQNSLTTADDI